MRDSILAFLLSSVALPWLCGSRSLAEEPRERATLDGHAIDVLCVAFSPDSKTLASVGRDSEIKLWDVSTGKKTTTLKGDTREIWTVRFSPDGKTLVSTADKNIKLWDLKTGKNTATFGGHTDGVGSVCFSADGKMLASGSGDKTIKLWDMPAANKDK